MQRDKSEGCQDLNVGDICEVNFCMPEAYEDLDVGNRRVANFTKEKLDEKFSIR